MRTTAGPGSEWRDASAYQPLLDADRSLFAWEWLRRDPDYAACARQALPDSAAERRLDQSAARFGLAGFEPPDVGVPLARPMWLSEVHPPVLPVDPDAAQADPIASALIGRFATVTANAEIEHLLLSDGLRAIRLDGPPGTFAGRQWFLCTRIGGLIDTRPSLLTLRRFVALCGRGAFARSLHPREARARRWILMLRAWDAARAGASQRDIAALLIDPRAATPRWRIRDSSLRSRAQRLVRAAGAMAGGGFRTLLD